MEARRDFLFLLTRRFRLLERRAPVLRKVRAAFVTCFLKQWRLYRFSFLTCSGGTGIPPPECAVAVLIHAGVRIRVFLHFDLAAMFARYVLTCLCLRECVCKVWHDDLNPIRYESCLRLSRDMFVCDALGSKPMETSIMVIVHPYSGRSCHQQGRARYVNAPRAVCLVPAPAANDGLFNASHRDLCKK